MALRPAVRRAAAVGRLARGLCSSSPSVGLGYCTPELTGASESQLFKAMMHQIDNPSAFLPVSRVRVQPATGAAFAEGALWRSMRYDGTGPLAGKVLTEHIYADAEARRIRFVGLQSNGKEGEYETCLELHTDPLRIELYRRERATGKRVVSETPLEEVIEAMNITLRLARAAQAEADDPMCIGVKA